MALSVYSSSLFLYNFRVTQNNSSIDFRAVAAETPRQATLMQGYYSLTSLLAEVERALEEADPARNYTASANRTVAGGTQNRVTISTNGAFFELLFSSGPRAASSSATLLGFTTTDKTGATSYTGQTSAGTVLVPNFPGYNYLSPDFNQKVFGSVNVSASGDKEAIVYQIQKFWQVQFKYIPALTWENEWAILLQWMIQQRRIEFTPDISAADSFFEGTLERTTADGKGLAYFGREMLPEFPDLYDTGLMTFRQNVETDLFLT